MQFTEEEKSTLTFALSRGIDRYMECIATIRGDDFPIPQPAKGDLIKTFEKQAADCAALIEKLEG